MRRITTLFMLLVVTALTVWAQETQLEVEPNTMHLVNLDGDETLERQLPMRCGFYKNNGDLLTLYPAVGELYTQEGGVFYTDDLDKTYFYEIHIPRALLGEEQQITEESGIHVRFYDIMRDEWVLNATSGTLRVVDKGDGTYAIDLYAIDANSNNVVAMNFDTDEAWRWREYGEMRPNPNCHKLTSQGQEYEVHELNSCVVDMADDNFARLYFCTTPGITTVEGMNQLPADDHSLVVIEMTKERMNGNFLSFSMTRNNPDLVLNIYYNGEVYSADRQDIDGGNASIECDAQTGQISAMSMLFTLPSPKFGDYFPNWNLKYDGAYTEVGGVAVEGASIETAIQLVEGENVIPMLSNDDPARWYKVTAESMKRTKVSFTGYPVMEAFVGDLTHSLGYGNPIDYINEGEEQTIYIRLQSTNAQDLTATVSYAQPVADLTSFGTLAYSIDKNGDVAAGSSITVTFPQRVGGTGDDAVSLSYYIFSIKGGNPDGAPVNLGGNTMAVGTLGEGVSVAIDGLTEGKKYRLAVQSLSSGSHFAPGYDEPTIDGGSIDFYYTEATGVVTVAEGVNQNRVLFNLAGQRVNATAKGIVIVNGKKYIEK